jgi:hypothetical protein
MLNVAYGLHAGCERKKGSGETPGFMHQRGCATLAN